MGTSTKFPVMVFFHGGGYTQGSPEQFPAQGTLGAVGSSNVVCVGVAYRLGVFGFLNSQDVLSHNAGGLQNPSGLPVLVAQNPRQSEPWHAL